MATHTIAVMPNKHESALRIDPLPINFESDFDLKLELNDYTQYQSRHAREPSVEQIQVPRHPMPSMQAAFEESMLEASDTTTPSSTTKTSGDSAARRQLLLDQGVTEDTHANRWRQKPGQQHHQLWKLMSQISFGIYLLLNGAAINEEQVLNILQRHVDEIDEFLETTLEDFDLAQEDIDDRLKALNTALENIHVFDEMLEDREYRLQVVTGNELIEHIIARTSTAMNDALKDVQQGLDSTKEFGLYLTQEGTEPLWHDLRPEMSKVYEAMKGNADGWLKAYISLQTKGHHLGLALVQLGSIVAEMDRRAGEVSRKTRFSQVPGIMLLPNKMATPPSSLPPSHSSQRSLVSITKSPPASPQRDTRSRRSSQAYQNVMEYERSPLPEPIPEPVPESVPEPEFDLSAFTLQPRTYSPAPPTNRNQSPAHQTRRAESPAPRRDPNRSPARVAPRTESPAPPRSRARSPTRPTPRTDSPASSRRRARSPAPSTDRAPSPPPPRNLNRPQIPSTDRTQSPAPSHGPPQSPGNQTFRNQSPASSRSRNHPQFPSMDRTQSPAPSHRRPQSPNSQAYRNQSPASSRSRHHPQIPSADRTQSPAPSQHRPQSPGNQAYRSQSPVQPRNRNNSHVPPSIRIQSQLPQTIRRPPTPEPAPEIQRKPSLRTRFSFKRRVPAPPPIPPPPLPRMKSYDNFATSRGLDSAYCSDDTDRISPPRHYQQSNLSQEFHSYSPPPQSFGSTYVTSPRSDQQHFRPVRASPNSPLQRPWTAAPSHLNSTMRNSSGASVSGLSQMTTVTENGKQVRKKRSGFGWIKKAFALSEEEKAAFEARRREVAPNDYAVDRRPPVYLDGRRIR